MLMGPQNLPEQVRIVRNRISSAAAAALRNVDSVTLLAVSKAQPANKVSAANPTKNTSAGDCVESPNAHSSAAC